MGGRGEEGSDVIEGRILIFMRKIFFLGSFLVAVSFCWFISLFCFFFVFLGRILIIFLFLCGVLRGCSVFFSRLRVFLFVNL